MVSLIPKTSQAENLPIALAESSPSKFRAWSETQTSPCFKGLILPEFCQQNATFAQRTAEIFSFWLNYQFFSRPNSDLLSNCCHKSHGRPQPELHPVHESVTEKPDIPNHDRPKRQQQKRRKHQRRHDRRHLHRQFVGFFLGAEFAMGAHFFGIGGQHI